MTSRLLPKTFEIGKLPFGGLWYRELREKINAESSPEGKHG
jgi:hypothetical protein